MLRAGDEESFRVLYRRHAPAMFGLAVRLTRERADAEDALQEAWLRATGAFSRFEWRSSLRSWLCGYVVNCAREALRRRSPQGDVSEEGDAQDPGVRLDLDAALASLAPGHREVLLLHDVLGFTHEEIAAMLGVEPGTSKSQLFRARGILRLRLGGESAAGG